MQLCSLDAVLCFAENKAKSGEYDELHCSEGELDDLLEVEELDGDIELVRDLLLGPRFERGPFL